MTRKSDRKVDQNNPPHPSADTSRRRSKPYVAHRGRGNGAVFEVVVGRNRYSTGIASKPSSSRRARRRLHKSVLTKFLRGLADRHQLGDTR